MLMMHPPYNDEEDDIGDEETNKHDPIIVRFIQENYVTRICLSFAALSNCSTISWKEQKLSSLFIKI